MAWGRRKAEVGRIVLAGVSAPEDTFGPRSGSFVAFVVMATKEKRSAVVELMATEIPDAEIDAESKGLKMMKAA